MAPKAAPTACTFDVRQSIYKATIVMPAPTTAAQLVAKLVEELPKNFKMPVDKTTACLTTKESWDDKNEAETVVPADTIYEAGFYRLKFPQKPEGSSKGPVTCDFNFENKKGGETRPELIERYGATVQVRFPDADVAQTFINNLLVSYQLADDAIAEQERIVQEAQKAMMGLQSLKSAASSSATAPPSSGGGAAAAAGQDNDEEVDDADVVKLVKGKKGPAPRR